MKTFDPLRHADTIGARAYHHNLLAEAAAMRRSVYCNRRPGSMLVEWTRCALDTAREVRTSAASWRSLPAGG